MSIFTDFLHLFKWDTSNTQDLLSNFNVDKSLNENWDKIDEKVKDLADNKVEKIEGKGLSTKDYTEEEQIKLSNIESGAQINVVEGITIEGKSLLVSDKNVEIKDEEVTNARESRVKGKTFENVDERLEEIEDDISNINSSRGHVYGVRRKISNNSSSTWERIKDSIGLVANATKNGGIVQNDFDNISPWKDIISFNLDLTTKKKTAFFGDADFKFDGTNGDVYTHIPTFWIKVYQENDYEYVEIADYARTGFIEIQEFDIARYQTGLVNSVLHSYSGLVPEYNRTLASFRTLAKAIGSEFCIMDWRYFILQYLYLVEYANYNSQGMLGNGMVALRVSGDDKALIAESGVNRFIVNTTGGNAFIIGQNICIGTSSAWNANVAKNRKITAISNYESGSISGKAITFDGAAVDIATTNVIWSSGQSSGGCDILGMKSGCVVNDSKHSIIYRGIENFFGNLWHFVDGINITDNQTWICKNPSDYVSDKFETPYEMLGYINSNANGYAKTLGFDINNPLIRLTTEVGGSNSTYMCDYYYQNTGNRLARVGGYFHDGSTAGLWCWNLNDASSVSYWSIGARVLKYQ